MWYRIQLNIQLSCDQPFEKVVCLIAVGPLKEIVPSGKVLIWRVPLTYVSVVFAVMVVVV